MPGTATQTAPTEREAALVTGIAEILQPILNPEKKDNYPLQLALRTRICLMAALLYDGKAAEAAQRAVELEHEVDVAIKNSRHEN